MNRAHTPGPWETSRDAVPDWHTQITVYAEADGQRVATVFREEANAYLIASAPDLLAALENYQRLVAYLQRTTNPEEWAEHGDWKRLQAEARAAVDKAKGP